MDLRLAGDDVYVGPPSPDRGLRTYGGQVIAQSLAAAQRTVSDDRNVHSTHSYFLKSGVAGKPLELRVERLRDGRSFSQRQVTALQDDTPVMQSLISFHVPEDGLAWQEAITIDVEPPNRAQPYTDYSDVIEAVLPDAEKPWPGRDRPMDVRYVNPPKELDGRQVTEPQRMWMRMNGDLGGDQALHDAGLAYLADLGMNPVILLPHGYSWRDERITEASMDHAIWFHRSAKANDWLYYIQQAEVTAGGRGLASGRFYDLDGCLVATCMQEGLMRWKG